MPDAPEVNYIYAATIERVVDGDTVDLTLLLGFDLTARLRARLHGCDTPEARGPERQAGEWVTRQVEAWFGEQKHVTVQSMVYRRDMYGRALFRVFCEGRDLTAWLLEKHYAWPTDDEGKLVVPRSIDALRLPDGIKASVREAMSS